MLDCSIYVSSGELMDRILYCLNNKHPLSVVSVGATETFVMAQYTVHPEPFFMNHPEASVANANHKRGVKHRGVRFPNIELRDAAVEAVKRADIIGYCLSVYNMDAGKLTEIVFEKNNIKPLFVFDAYIRRVIMVSQKNKFDKMLSGRKILLISTMAEEVKLEMEQKLQNRLGFTITGTILIDRYEDIPRVKREIADYDFDLCLLAAGTNALILAPYIAQTYGKVAFDLGQGMASLVSGEIEVDIWMKKIIGMDKLMKM
ncbi:hypothetical protein D3C78_566840 [compost metagenome]